MWVYWLRRLAQLTFTCLKSTTEILEKGVKYVHSGVFIVNFEHILYLFLVFILLIVSKYMLAGLPVNNYYGNL